MTRAAIIHDATKYAVGTPFPRPLRPDDLGDAVLYADRHDMAAHLFDGVARIAEVGTWRGGFARHILDACDPDELHLFDQSMDVLAASVANDVRVHLHEGDSATLLHKVPDAYFGGIYIDADHSLEGVRRDADVAKRKLAPDGVLIFNDYTLWSVIEGAPYGVCHAVADLCYDGFEIVGFAFQFQGYHDVALRHR